MGRLMTIAQTITATGLSEYTIRKGINEGRFPFTRTGINKGKFLLDIELLERQLEQEALSNTAGTGGVAQYGRIRRIY